MLDWVPGETVLENASAAQDPMVAVTGQILRGLVFRLTLNANGQITGVANQAELTPKLKEMRDTLVQAIAERLLRENERKSFANLAAQLLSPEAMIAGSTREAGIYFGSNGWSLGVGSLQKPKCSNRGRVEDCFLGSCE